MNTSEAVSIVTNEEGINPQSLAERQTFYLKRIAVALEGLNTTLLGKAIGDALDGTPRVKRAYNKKSEGYVNPSNLLTHLSQKDAEFQIMKICREHYANTNKRVISTDVIGEEMRKYLGIPYVHGESIGLNFKAFLTEETCRRIGLEKLSSRTYLIRI